MKRVRAATHVHSQWSFDAKWPLAKLGRAFGNLGYDVLLMSEHDRGFTEDRWCDYREDCAKASTDRVLVVPGIEYSDPTNTFHIPVWGELPFFGENLPTADLLRAVHEARGVAVFAHPSRKAAWRGFDPEWAEMLTGLEVWNRKTDGYAPSKDAPALLERSQLLPFAALDFHTARQFFPLSMELEVRGEVSCASVYEAIRERRCQAVAFGQPADSFTSGLRGRTVEAAENARRPLAKLLRSFRAPRTKNE